MKNFELFERDLIQGGLSDDHKNILDIIKYHQIKNDKSNIRMLNAQVKKGISVEREHTDNDEIAKEIAMDHLMEDPEYYSKLETIEESASHVEPDNETWKSWRKLINMSKKDLQAFYNSPEGKDAGMKQKDANSKGIDSGRESCRMLMKMLPYGETFASANANWTPDMWRWARKQISFISRMRGVRKRMVGDPFERDGEMTRWLKSLLIWGHDPRKILKKIK